ncbi:PaiB family negative transcriptional regulator [Branchiibius hedensis]|uniref:Negative transcriptional regulator, PaiB family n=1 Tax=Branchiibius hedensis TaxID=672460 RepID=A0A2Y8ZSB1_9MICO|nr:FMN-binding negative transcriptional regulator [Branchiibius hedensis]PWJ26022.1 PaiB family negative transcriptional regulator [Branchiibius hedensis]SSA34834.1 negative transcriptional regulator, PaiB family [Branchiibius hedensis]
MVYLPEHDAAADAGAVVELLRNAPLAALVTSDGRQLAADHVPLLLEGDVESGRLIGHVARANPLWHNGRHEGESLAIFNGAQHYVSPTWYPSKEQHHRVVPTWNYLIAHVYGEVVVHDDERWVRAAVAKLTKAMESQRPQPWRMADAPANYLTGQLGNVVGIEIAIARVVAKFKVSAARSVDDRLGAAEGIAGEPDGLAATDLVTAMRDVTGDD